MTLEKFVEETLISLAKAGAIGEVHLDVWVKPRFQPQQPHDIDEDIVIVPHNEYGASNIKFSVFIGDKKDNK